MKTEFYNPSKLEIDFAKALIACKDHLASSLEGADILDIHPHFSADNPFLVIKVQDPDGDLHELVVQVIQRPDALVK